MRLGDAFLPITSLTIDASSNVEDGGATVSRQRGAWCSPCVEKQCAISLVCSLMQPADREAESVVPNAVIGGCEGVLAFVVL